MSDISDGFGGLGQAVSNQVRATPIPENSRPKLMQNDITGR